MPSLPYRLVDVFTARPFGGNPLAVFLPTVHQLATATMQQIANELNLSESVFVLPPDNSDAAYRLRIFTPQVELPMAGHPTVGAGFVLAREGLLDVPGDYICEEGVGDILISLYRDNSGSVWVQMQQPLPEFGKVWDDRASIAALVNLTEADLLPDFPVQHVSTGVPFMYIPLRDQEALARASLRLDRWNASYREAVPQMFLFTPDADTDNAVRSRMFAPGMGITEDPATGAASGPLGAYLVEYGLLPAGEIINQQGYEMGRPSEIRIRIEQEQGAYSGIFISGTSVYMGAGTLEIQA